MVFLIITLIVALIGGIIAVFNDNNMLGELYTTVFDCGQYLTTATGVEFFSLLMPITYGVGVALIILKFLKKAFDIYVLWTDGDPDADPILLLTNFVRAIATALIFQWVYQLFVDICREITDSICSVINSNSDFTQEWINSLSTAGLVPAIAGLMFFIIYVILYFQFMARGIEMMIMQVGVPLACIGLLDNDKGVFKAFVNQFVKAFITTIVQILLVKIGLSLVMQSTVMSWGNILWGIACMLAALSMPKILREFLVPTGGDGKMGNTVFQSVRVLSMAKSAFK